MCLLCPLSAVEHVPLTSKLRRGVEIPFSEQDAAGAEFETDSEEPELDGSPAAASTQQDQEQQEQDQPAAATPQSGPRKQRKQPQQAEGVRQQRGDDSDFELDSEEAAPLSDDNVLDSDAMVSDDHPPSEMDSELSDDLPLAFKQRGGSISKQAGGVQARQGGRASTGGSAGPKRKLNTPNKQQQRPTGGVLGPVASHRHADALGDAAGPGVNGAAAGGQQVLGKRRGSSDGGPEAKRHAAAAAAADAAGPDAAPGTDAFKKAMLEKLLAKKTAAGGAAGSTSGSVDAAAAHHHGHHSHGHHGHTAGKHSAGKQQHHHQHHHQRRLEPRLSGSGGSGTASLQRALSDHDVRQKATAQLVTGLQRAAQEAQEKHQQRQQQQQGGAAPQQQQQQEGQQPQEGQEPAAGGAATSEAAAGQQGAEQQQQPDNQQQQQQAVAPEGVSGPLQLPDPQEVAETIEHELFTLCGESTGVPNRGTPAGKQARGKAGRQAGWQQSLAIYLAAIRPWAMAPARVSWSGMGHNGMPWCCICRVQFAAGGATAAEWCLLGRGCM